MNDQIGCPTPSFLVGECVGKILNHLENNNMEPTKDIYGTYHVCSNGSATWYELSIEIKKLWGLDLDITPISSQEFSVLNPGQAIRPSFSVLDNTKFSKTFDYQFLDWKTYLKKIHQSMC